MSKSIASLMYATLCDMESDYKKCGVVPEVLRFVGAKRDLDMSFLFEFQQKVNSKTTAVANTLDSE